MSRFQNKRVSQEWAVILGAAEDAGVRFQLNSGQRTMEEQWSLYNAYRNGSGVLAAYPNAKAPHIRTPNHAIDVDSVWNGENHLQEWLRSEGASATNTVSGEVWHLEISNAALDFLYDLYRDTHGFPNPARRWIREYDRLVRQNEAKTKDRRLVLRRAMKEERKKYWGRPSKAKIYAALLKRSR